MILITIQNFVYSMRLLKLSPINAPGASISTYTLAIRDLGNEFVMDIYNLLLWSWLRLERLAQPEF